MFLSCLYVHSFFRLKTDPHLASQKTWNGYFLAWYSFTGRDQVFPFQSPRWKHEKAFCWSLCSYIVTYSTETVKWEWKKAKMTWVIDVSIVVMFCFRVLLTRELTADEKNKGSQLNSWSAFIFNSNSILNLDKHLDQGAVSSAGKCTRKRKKKSLKLYLRHTCS